MLRHRVRVCIGTSECVGAFQACLGKLRQVHPLHLLEERYHYHAALLLHLLLRLLWNLPLHSIGFEGRA